MKKPEFPWDSVWAKKYKQTTRKDPYYLEQIWDGRKLWLPAQDYVEWLEKKLSKK